MGEDADLLQQYIEDEEARKETSMREIDTLFMLVREYRSRLRVIHHKPGKTAREAWNSAINEYRYSFMPNSTSEDIERLIRDAGWKAKRVRLFLVEH